MPRKQRRLRRKPGMKVLWPGDVMQWWTGRNMFPKEYEPYIEWDQWTWYCSVCLEKKTWGQFPRSKLKWPQNICLECQGRRVLLGRRRGLLGGRNVRRFKYGTVQALANTSRNPTACETLAKVIIDEMGGMQGVSEFVRKLVHEPVIREGHEARKAIIYAALVRCMEVAVHSDLERRRIEATKESLKQKSLSKFSDQDLKDALGPLVLETLTKRPEVGIKALKNAGYVVEKTPRQLAAAIKRRDERFKREFMREMMK